VSRCVLTRREGSRGPSRRASELEAREGFGPSGLDPERVTGDEAGSIPRGRAGPRLRGVGGESSRGAKTQERNGLRFEATRAGANGLV
jgi:hypothetical protein